MQSDTRRSQRVARFALPDATLAARSARAPTLGGVRLGPAESRTFVDAYYDTPDGALARRGVTCRVRSEGDGIATLTVAVRGLHDHSAWDAAGRWDAELSSAELDAILGRAANRAVSPGAGAGAGEAGARLAPAVDPARRRMAMEPEAVARLVSLVDVGRLTSVAELHTVRLVRHRRTVLGSAEPSITIDTVTLRGAAPEVSFHELTLRAHSPAGARRIDAMAESLRAELGVEPSGAPRLARARELLAEGAGGEERCVESDTFLSADLSFLEFNQRILELSDDARVPLLERVRLLAIAGANLDEFFMGRMDALRRDAARDPSPASDAARAKLDAAVRRARTLAATHDAHLRALEVEMARSGVRLVVWDALDPAARARASRHFRAEYLPRFDRLGVTLSPGHPFPRAPQLNLSLAVLFRERHTGAWHLSQLDLPTEFPRFLHVPDTDDVIALEDVVRAHVGELYPDESVEAVYAFRVTRGAELALAPRAGDGLLRTVDEATRRRPYNPIVRVEVERAMPAPVREMLLAELRTEPGVGASALAAADVYAVETLLGTRDLYVLAEVPRPELLYAPFRGRALVPADRSLWDVLRQCDVLAHHPYDDFEPVVQRFFDEAADDPAVESIAVTLYRAGERSGIVDALVRARAAGKRVVACVELRARFDERRNISWAQRLADAGAQVVHGFGPFKVHAKAALVERREGGRITRYAHVGSGNYNARTARSYTDFSLLTSDPAVGEDLAALFGALSDAAAPDVHRCLVAPWTLLPALLERIEREIAHAAAGDGGRIRLKLNGLSDPELVDALYRASRAGVEVDLVVRGICTLRPGVHGLSERIRVVCTMGRFLEHGRIYHFANAGRPEYFIGSADWRSRNLRHRVELMVPVTAPGDRARLDRLLDIELRDPTAWDLKPNGSYERRAGWREAVSAQEELQGGALSAER